MILPHSAPGFQSGHDELLSDLCVATLHAAAPERGGGAGLVNVCISSRATRSNRLTCQERLVDWSRFGPLGRSVRQRHVEQWRDVVAVVEVAPGGTIARRVGLGTASPVGGDRGDVWGFSAASRGRLMRLLARVDWGALLPSGSCRFRRSQRAHFVTLTYPESYPGDWQVWKAHLKAFLMRLQRRFPDLRGVLWKLEFQERGAPHFHLLTVFDGSRDVVSFRRWVLRSWFEVCKTGDDAHGRSGTSVEQVYGPASKLMAYMTKYLAKPGLAPCQTGRVWGLWGELPQGEVREVRLTWSGWCEFCRRLRRWGRGSRYLRRLRVSALGFLVYGGPDGLGQLLRGLEQGAVRP